MNVLDAAVLGIIEGITEFLPVSSTAHLILAGKLLGLGGGDFLKSFDIAIQLGAILAVVWLYRGKISPGSDIVKKTAAAFIPTAVGGALFYKAIKNVLMENNAVIIAALFIGGALMIAFEAFFRPEKKAAPAPDRISYGQAVGIGCLQCLAFIPGVSRSAATIFGGMALGVGRKAIVEFSFILAVPTMFAAVSLDLLKNYKAFSRDQFFVMAAGFAASFFVAVAAIKFLIRFISNRNFTVFGVYRIVAALCFWYFLIKL